MVSDNSLYVHDDETAFDYECPQCGEGSVTTQLIHDSFEYGTGESSVTLQVDLPVRKCLSCGLQYIDHEGEQIRHEAVCRHLGLLSPAEISRIREVYGMSRAAFSDLTGLGEATLSRWENGGVIQNLANDRYLRLLSLPGVIASLKELTASRVISDSGFRNHPQFRVLRVSAEQRNRQMVFQLRRLAS